MHASVEEPMVNLWGSGCDDLDAVHIAMQGVDDQVPFAWIDNGRD